MLTASQCEIVAYVGDGEIICRDCAVAEYSELTISKLDEGLPCAAGDLSPLIRYSVDELSGERQYEWAGERLDAFLDRHPAISLEDRQRWTLLDHLAERQPGESCGQCGDEL